VHDANCNVTVRNVPVALSPRQEFGEMMTAVQALGYNRTDRKYMIFMDAAVYCGIGTLYGDDSPLASNANNRGPSYARADRGCWNGHSIAHEHMHNLGGVQRSAPHSTGWQVPSSGNTWHCSDESDVMCYSDADGVVMTYPCPSSQEMLFDCNNDDYFHTSPAAGSYLATHWNAAVNQFLTQAAVLPPPSTGSLHVADLDGVGAISNKNWRATVIITIANSDGQPVSAATVTGGWSGGATGSGSCTTGIRGSAACEAAIFPARGPPRRPSP
jgi:hypothetical protein